MESAPGSTSTAWTSQAHDAGVGSTAEALFTARTSSACRPEARPAKLVPVARHGANAAPSRLHSNSRRSTDDAGSTPWKVNVARPEVVNCDGAESIAVSGGGARRGAGGTAAGPFRFGNSASGAPPAEPVAGISMKRSVAIPVPSSMRSPAAVVGWPFEMKSCGWSKGADWVFTRASVSDLRNATRSSCSCCVRPIGAISASRSAMFRAAKSPPRL
jgi:hypothetical protein